MARIKRSKPLLVLGPRYTDDSNNLWRAALDLGWSHLRLKSFRPTDGEIEEIKHHAKITFYGESLVFDALKEAIPYLNIVQPNDSWLTDLPKKYLNRRVGYVPFWVAKQLANAFVKPPDEKLFEAKVYETGELENLAKVDDDFMCIVSEPVQFLEEYRCFCRHRRVVDHSSYLINGGLDFSVKNDQALNLAKNVLEDLDVDVPLSMTLDVGLFRKGGLELWGVVEANQSWASGLYGCDPKEVLKSLNMAVIPYSHKDVVRRKWLR